MYDETNKYCKIFHGPQENLYEYCFELGFSSSPPISECISAADLTSNNNCDVSLQDGSFLCKFHKCYIKRSFQYSDINSRGFGKITVVTKKIFLTIWTTLTTWTFAKRHVRSTPGVISSRFRRMNKFASYTKSTLKIVCAISFTDHLSQASNHA